MRSVPVGAPDDDTPSLEIQQDGAVIAVTGAPDVHALGPVLDVVPTVLPALGMCIAGTPVASQDGGTPTSDSPDRTPSPELQCTHDIRKPFRDGRRLMGWSRINCPAAVGAIVKINTARMFYIRSTSSGPQPRIVKSGNAIRFGRKAATLELVKTCAANASTRLYTNYSLVTVAASTRPFFRSSTGQELGFAACVA